MVKIITKTTEETKQLAKEILDNIKSNVILLNGDLGSGKTVFVKGLAEKLKIKDVVNSPTFVIMKIYDIESGKYKRLIHIDLYRLDEVTKEDLVNLGVDEYINDTESLVVVEWADKIKDEVVGDVINFKVFSEQEREIKY